MGWTAPKKRTRATKEGRGSEGSTTRSSPRKRKPSAKLLATSSTNSSAKAPERKKASSKKATETVSDLLASRGLVVAGNKKPVDEVLDEDVEDPKDDRSLSSVEDDNDPAVRPKSSSEEESLEADSDDEEDAKPAAKKSPPPWAHPSSSRTTSAVKNKNTHQQVVTTKSASAVEVYKPSKETVFRGADGTPKIVSRRLGMYDDNYPVDIAVWDNEEEDTAIEDMKKKIYKFVRHTSIRNTLFFVDNKDANEVVGMCLYDLGMQDPGLRVGLLRVRWWEAVRWLIIQHTSSLRQTIIRDWYLVLSGKFFVFLL
jgi:hypothetical protein